MSWCSRHSLALAAVLLMPVLARPARAQGWREVQVWGVAVASAPAVYAGGLGLSWRDRGRTRVGLALAGGATEGGSAAARAELAWHFLLDPARRRGAGLYAGGGLALTAVERDVVRPRIQVTLGVDIAPGGSGGLFVEAGVGGGARLAAGLRFRKRSAPDRSGRGASSIMPHATSQDTPASAVAGSERATTGRQ